VIVDVASLEERVEFEARELQQLTRFVMRQRAGAVALDRERLNASRPGFGRCATSSGNSIVIFFMARTSE